MIREFLLDAAVVLSSMIPGVWLGTVFADEIKALWRKASLRLESRPAPSPAYVPQHAATMPRRKPLVNRQPWQTAEFPAVPVPEAQQAAEEMHALAAGEAHACIDGRDEAALALVRPHAPLTDEETRELYFTRGLSPDCANGCHAPLCSGRNCSCGCHGKAAPAYGEPPALNPLLAASAPVYGEAPQDAVDEAQRLAEVMQP